MPISTLKKVPGPRDTQSSGTKKSWDLETPKVPGFENGKSPGKMPTPNKMSL